MADVLVNAPPVVQLEQLQPPRGVVAGFSSEAELSQQQVEMQEQLQQFWSLLVQTCLQRGEEAVPTGQSSGSYTHLVSHLFT